jgi:hypothetical protein
MIEFERKEVGDKLSLSFGRISRQDYKEGLVVVSCIYREETHDTWYTSVDMIRLVEYIAQTQFSSEEKSRIRRNLEFLHPTTVSRTGMPKFFQTLMDFPLPKPRVIEKDIKVFQWNSLEAGLKKVLEKYVRFVFVRFSLNLEYCYRPGLVSRRPPQGPQIPVLNPRRLGYPRINSRTLHNSLHRIPSALQPHPTVPIHQTAWGSPASCQIC